MFQEKLEQTIQTIKKTIAETFKLLWSFKWYIVVYLLFYCLLIVEYFNPPAVDDPIWGAEAVRRFWPYTNQTVYLGNLLEEIKFTGILFLLATSNMRNHPKFAKILFLYPLFVVISGLLTEMFFV